MKDIMFLEASSRWNPWSLAMLWVLMALLGIAGTGSLEASLDRYDREVAQDRTSGLPYTAAVTEAIALDGATAIPFNFGPVSGSATIEFIVSGDPVAGGASAYLAVGTNASWNLRFEQWNNTSQLGFTHLSVADYAFTPPVDSPTQPTHVAYRYDAGTSVMDLYLNGELAASAAAPNWEMPAGRGWLGGRSNAGAEAMVGVMERVTVYNSAIDPEAIRRHADAWLALPARVIEFNSDAGSILVDGVEQVDGLFLGVPFTATAYNGKTRFLFAGDLAFGPGDVVRGTGSQAINLTASGDVTIPESVVIDVSALLEEPGPGGGAGGSPAAGGDGGGGGTRGHWRRRWSWR